MDKTTAAGQKKLSYKLQRELESLPQQIAKLESEQNGLQVQANDPQFYSQAHEVTAAVLHRLNAIDDELVVLLERWEELENLQQESR